MVRHCLCVVSPLPPWLRHFLCVVSPLSPWLRHCICLVSPLPPRLRHRLCPAFGLLSWLITPPRGSLGGIEAQISKAMRSGGMSIFITSLTDCLAFLIGSSTVLPALHWFCIFAGFGIFFCFLFQIIFFMPCLVRPQATRNGGRSSGLKAVPLFSLNAAFHRGAAGHQRQARRGPALGRALLHQGLKGADDGGPTG